MSFLFPLASPSLPLSNVSPNFWFSSLIWYNVTFSGPGIWSFRAGSAPSTQWPFFIFLPTPCLSCPQLKGTYSSLWARVRDRVTETESDRFRERIKFIQEILIHSNQPGWLVDGWVLFSLSILYVQVHVYEKERQTDRWRERDRDRVCISKAFWDASYDFPSLTYIQT